MRLETRRSYRFIFKLSIISLTVTLIMSLTACRSSSQLEESAKSKDSPEIKQPAYLPSDLLRSNNIVYQGAFRLPGGSNGSNWEYGGSAMTYHPDGDPDGPDDGYPGSLFGVGHDQQQQVSEINIPTPVISKKKRLKELKRASTLQKFEDITGGRYGELEIPRAGIEYLPSQLGQSQGKLHFSWGEHFQFKRKPALGWSELDISIPQTQGIWFLGEFTNYIMGDYLFEIPQIWAEANLPGHRLATGRFRDGTWSGFGPAILAYAPADESDPPRSRATIRRVKPLLLYGTPRKGDPEIRATADQKMVTFNEPDEWSGAAWLTSGNRAAVILVGTKATGKAWYGFANGVVYPTSGDEDEEVPDVPPWPFDDRGWWSEGIMAQMIFYRPSDLADVAKGKKESWQPQPYNSLDLTKYLFDPGFDHKRQKRYLVGGVSFDRERGILYVFERRGDGERSLVHVFKLFS